MAGLSIGLEPADPQREFRQHGHLMVPRSPDLGDALDALGAAVGHQRREIAREALPQLQFRSRFSGGQICARSADEDSEKLRT